MTVPYAIQAMKEQKILSDAVTSGHISTDINTLKIMFESGAISAQNIPETQFIKITVKTSDYQSAKQICMAVSQAFVSYGKRIFAKRKEFIEQQIKELENKYQFYSRSLVTQPVTANIISLNEDLLNAEDFEVTDIPISNGVGERAVSERRLLFIILTGLIIAVLFAFIQDFMANLAYDYRKT
jgi:capsular polysaccharide biosynthesis protein